MYARSAKQILSKINEPFLDLVRVTGKEGGYWYFVYDDGGSIYETESVYCMRLNDMQLDRWVETGKELVTKVNRELPEKEARYENMTMIFKNMEK